MLAKLTVELNKWDKSLPQLELVLNNAVNRSTGYSPSKLLFGVNQSYLEDDNIKTYLESIQKDSRDLLTIRAEASTKMELVGKYNKDQFDNRHKSPRKYQVGDYVVIKNVDVSVGINKKLIPKFRGPYMVSEIYSNDRYLLKDIPGFQHTQVPFSGVYDTSRMRPWLSSDCNSLVKLN
nr:PREDICTED: uncharacterized protein LOC107397616 [Tribolium castaneum]|eukprot:XP_015833859.1 PREDICTED: uncharacterized protein LOC107397616 [Tribolium castaneum]